MSRLAEIGRAIDQDNIALLNIFINNYPVYCSYEAIDYAVKTGKIKSVSFLLTMCPTRIASRSYGLLWTLTDTNDEFISRIIINAAINEANTPEKHAALVVAMTRASQLTEWNHMTNTRSAILDLMRFGVDLPRRSSRVRIPKKTSELCARCNIYHNMDHETCHGANKVRY